MVPSLWYGFPFVFKRPMTNAQPPNATVIAQTTLRPARYAAIMPGTSSGVNADLSSAAPVASTKSTSIAGMSRRRVPIRTLSKAHCAAAMPKEPPRIWTTKSVVSCCLKVCTLNGQRGHLRSMMAVTDDKSAGSCPDWATSMEHCHAAPHATPARIWNPIQRPALVSWSSV